MGTPLFLTTADLLGAVQISTANTNRDGTGTITTLVTGGTNGTRVLIATVSAVTLVNDGMIRFFITPSGGSTYLWHEEPVWSVVPSASSPAFQIVVSFDTKLLFLGNGDTVGVSTEKAETFNVLDRKSVV